MMSYVAWCVLIVGCLLLLCVSYRLMLCVVVWCLPLCVVGCCVQNSVNVSGLWFVVCCC